jgi:hypothetical protein
LLTNPDRNEAIARLIGAIEQDRVELLAAIVGGRNAPRAAADPEAG